MKPLKLLAGAAGFSIAAAAFMSGAGKAAADGPDTICIDLCQPQLPPGLLGATIKIASNDQIPAPVQESLSLNFAKIEYKYNTQ